MEWILARDLLAAALHSREGIGDVQAWPSAAAVEAFLAQTYQVVPDGTESDYMDFDAELTELLSQA